MSVETLIVEDRRRAVDAAARYRLHAESLLARAEYLDPPERAMLEQVYGRGVSIATVARIAGVPPRTMQARVRRLLEHLNEPLVKFVVGRLSTWPRRRRAVAIRHIVRRESQRSVARELAITVHRVRCEVEAIRTLFHAERERFSS